MTEMKPWQTLRSRLMLDHSPWLRVYADDVELPDGRVIEGYLRLEARGYAMIVPVDKDSRIGFIRSYKRGVNDIDMQPPAGMLESGEDPFETAQRELKEEMGCVASQWIPLGAYIIGGNVGMGRAHLFLATGCEQITEPDSGDLEEQEVVWLPMHEARRRWIEGEFRQIATMAALGLAFAHLDPDETLQDSTDYDQGEIEA